MVYRGTITIRSSGVQGNPITYSGDSWPGLESLSAILDGSTLVSGNWVQCQSPADCGGNPQFANIYYLDLPSPRSFQDGVYADGDFLWYSQDPNPTDPFYYDRIEYFRTIPLSDPSVHQNRTSITDPRFFTQGDPSFYDGAYVAVWRIPNVVRIRKITSYDPLTYTLVHEDLGGEVYADRDAYYCILNHLAYLDTPSEYVIQEDTARLYVWPSDSGSPEFHSIGLQSLNTGILSQNKHDLNIEGFTLQSYIQGIRAIEGSSDIAIRHNTVRNLKSNDWYAINISGTTITVEHNHLFNDQRAVGILSDGKHHVIRNNFIERTSRQGIWLMNNEHAQVLDNRIDDINGSHSNGMSFYLYNKDILVANNQVWNTASSITWSGNSDPTLSVGLTLYNNFFQNAANSWDYDMRGVTLLGNTFLGGLNNEGDEDSIMVNNIIGGGGTGTLGRSYNLYTALFWNQAPEYGWTLHEGEFVELDLNSVFVNPATGDFRLKEGSAAIDAGTDITLYFPTDRFPNYDFARGLEGNPRPQGASWDLGPYEAPSAEAEPTLTPTVPAEPSGERSLSVWNWGLYN